MTVAVVDDHELFRQGVIAILDQHSAMKVVGEGESSRDALRLVTEFAPSLVILDVELDGSPAVSTIRDLKKASPQTLVVMLTMHSDHILKNELLNAGADAFFTKSIAGRELARRLTEVVEGKNTQAIPRPPIQANLTFREAQVLRLMMQARTNRDIGIQLSIAEGTVKRHTSSIFQKLGVLSRMEAVSRAKLLGVFDEENWPQEGVEASS